ncbi:MAG: hypothetical protein AB7S38_29015 [Vulcanimicrobiota bacterium]
MDRRWRNAPMKVDDDTKFVGTRFSLPVGAKSPAGVGSIVSGLVVAQGGTLKEVRLRAATLPNTTDSFSFNVKNDGDDVFASAQVFGREFNPSGFAKTVDNGANFTNYLTQVTGSGVAAVGALDTAANGDYIYASFDEIAAGMKVVMDGVNVNDQASVMTAEYPNGTTWGALTITDGTASGGATLAQSGNITWTPPADWAKVAVGSLGTRYWVRFKVSAVLAATVNIDTVLAIRDVGVFYAFTPDQNTEIADGAELRIAITEADANAAGLEFILNGSF